MAVIISAPPQNNTLCDANITEIVIEDSTTIFSYYFANISLNNTFFDKVIMPRTGVNNTRMILDFDNLILKYMKFQEIGVLAVPGVVINGFIQYFSVIYDLKIEIYRQPNDTLTGAQKMFEFNYQLFYSTNPTTERYMNHPLSFIGVDADSFLVSPKTFLKFPFYVSELSGTVTLEAKTESGIVINSYNQILTNPLAKKTMLGGLRVEVPDDVHSYFFNIKYGDHIITKKIRVMRNKKYVSKPVLFYNRFGMPVEVELFGKKTAKDDLTFFKYQNRMAVHKMAEIQENTIFTIDSGYMVDSEKAVISQIATSLDVRITEKGYYMPCVVNTKSITTFSENDFVTNTQLQFELNKNPKIKNQ